MFERYYDFETQLMSIEEGNAFSTWFRREIGTEFDRNNDSNNQCCFICLDLTASELKRTEKRIELIKNI